jgi:hypothetical protein
MRIFLALFMVAALAATAFAGGNPNVKGYISFDPASPVHEVTPAPYTTINAYICFTDLEMGLTSASFMVTDVATVCPGVFAPPSFINLISDVAIGNVFTGITVASTGCEPPPTCCVGYVSLFYLAGGSCCIELLPHPDYPLWVTDCNDPALVDYYCVLSHGSVAGAPCPDGDCDQNPVEDATWGGIKSLYR